MADNDFDSVQVDSFEVVPTDDGAKVVISGPPHPRPLVVGVTGPKLAALIAGLLMAYDKLDRAALINDLREILSRLTGDAFRHGQEAAAPLPAPSAADGVADAGSASTTDRGFSDFEWLVHQASALQKRCQAEGISDALTASLAHVVFNENALLVFAQQQQQERNRRPAATLDQIGAPAGSIAPDADDAGDRAR